MKNVYPPIADPYQYIQSVVLLSISPRKDGEQFLTLVARLPQEAQDELAHIIQKLPHILPKIVGVVVEKENAILLGKSYDVLNMIIEEEEKLLEEIEKFDAAQ